MAERRTQKVDEDAADRLSDAEVKAAKKAPPGDTELSGAAPGIKTGAVTDDNDPKPVEAKTVESDKTRDEIAEIQRDTTAPQVLENVPETVATVMHGHTMNQKRPKEVRIQQVGQDVFLSIGSEQVRMDREEFRNLQRDVRAIGAAI